MIFNGRLCRTRILYIILCVCVGSIRELLEPGPRFHVHKMSARGEVMKCVRVIVVVA